MWDSPWNWFLEPANQWLLFCTAAAFAIGLLMGRWIRRSKRESVRSDFRKGDEAFFKGIQYILSNDHDHAIEEFTKSVQINSDTVETYMALGNLYRSKGDIDRAIRIRQSIILRPSIDEKLRLGALHELGLDYRKGGFLNLALETLLKVAHRDPSNTGILREMEKIYEEMKDWENAYRTRKNIARLEKGDHDHILAHHLVERGKAFQEEGQLTQAISFFNKAISTHPQCVDAYLHLGDAYFSNQEYRRAVSAWRKVVDVAPHFTFLAYRRLEGAYSRMDNLKPVEDFLRDCAESNMDAFTHMALARYLYNKNDVEGALREVANALRLNGAFWEARKFRGQIFLAHGKDQEVLSDYEELVDHLNMPYLRFQCVQCGFRPEELHWQCPKCREWDSIKLVDSADGDSSAASHGHPGASVLMGNRKE
jgi:lipopolysaccharide biosynthesis regulator YciM